MSTDKRAGVYQGADVAIKLAVTSSIDKSNMREMLVSPQLRHPHVRQLGELGTCRPFDLRKKSR